MENKIKSCCDRCCIKECENRKKFFIVDCDRFKEKDNICMICKYENTCEHNQGFINALECLWFCRKEVKQ